MTVTHPDADRGASPAAVTVGTDTYLVDSDGVIDCPDDVERSVAARLARVSGCDIDALLDAGTCEVIKADGDVCGREKPCRYHDDEGA